MKAPLRILLADDHLTMRHGLKLLIDSQPDMQVVAEASDGDGAVQNTLALSPDIVVMDISMPGTNGLAATRTLKQLRPDAAIVVLTRHGDDAYLQEFLRAGVVGICAEAERLGGTAAGDSRRRGRRAVSRFQPDRAGHRCVPARRRGRVSKRRRR